MPDYFNMENPYSDIRARTRKEDALIQQLEQDNLRAREHNEAKKNSKPVIGPLKRYCGLCEAPLIKTKKLDKLEGLDIDIPRYKCKTCGQAYSGFGLELFTQNKKVKAICFEYDGTI